MIASVQAHNFKGATFTAPLGGLTLAVGPNGAGKSSRSQAAQLAILGYVPGVARRNGDIMDAFHDGQGKDLRAGVTLDSGHKIERRFTRSSRTGTVSQEIYSGGIKVRPDEFARALTDVRVVDLSAFLGLSDAKKIDEIFRLFPPEGNVQGLVEKIEKQAKLVNSLESKERDAMNAVATILAQRSKIALPAGSMADKQNEIDRAEADLKQARAELEAERIEAARVEEQAKVEQAARPPEPAPVQHGIDGGPRQGTPAAGAKVAPSSPATVNVQTVLQDVLAAMDRAGCDVCAAKMVIKRELAKARQGQPMEAVA